MRAGVRQLIFSVAVAVAFSASADASAQRAPRAMDRTPGKSSLSADELVPEQEAQKVMNDYAACIARRSRSRVEQFFGLLAESEEANAAAVRLASQHCLSDGQLRFKPSLFRGGLYEAFYVSDFKESAPLELAAAPVIDYANGRQAPFEQRTTYYLALIDVADCAVRADVISSRKLVLSEVASSQEVQAFEALTPKLGSCLTKGVELKFSRPVLRGYIAESLYRLSAKAGRPALAEKK